MLRDFGLPKGASTFLDACIGKSWQLAWSTLFETKVRLNLILQKNAKFPHAESQGSFSLDFLFEECLRLIEENIGPEPERNNRNQAFWSPLSVHMANKLSHQQSASCCQTWGFTTRKEISFFLDCFFCSSLCHKV